MNPSVSANSCQGSFIFATIFAVPKRPFSLPEWPDLGLAFTNSGHVVGTKQNVRHPTTIYTNTSSAELRLRAHSSFRPSCLLPHVHWCYGGTTAAPGHMDRTRLRLCRPSGEATRPLCSPVSIKRKANVANISGQYIGRCRKNGPTRKPKRPIRPSKSAGSDRAW